MAYTPELNMEYSGILRRIAWAYAVPMTKAMEGILELAARYMDSERVCEACRDKSFCDCCIFFQETR
jgi:hypothetical protein